MAVNVPILKTKRLILRNISEKDTENIVLWRSDPEVYKFFVSPHIITKEEHLNWYKNKYLTDENRYDWMALDVNGQSIGVFGIRRDTDSDIAEISYILAPDKRGMGYAKEAVQELIVFLKNIWKCKYATANIHENNKDSIRFAVSLGMKLYKNNGMFCEYRMVINNKKSGNKKIYIRADGNAIIGMGHIMRCLSIANQLKKFNIDVTFITADNEVKDIIENEGFDNICLDTMWNSMEDELSDFCHIIKENEVNIVIIDSYYITKKYMKELRKYSTTCYLDDFNSLDFYTDILINYNIYADLSRYDSKLYRCICMGVDFVPLRDEFLKNKERSFRGIKNILITSGGTDEYNVIGNILESFFNNREFNKYNYYCIIGKFNRNIHQLKDKYKKYKNVHLLNGISNISKYMMDCDIAVTAGGSTCYELCACGIPAVMYTLADNQIGIAKTFSEKKIISWMGDIRVDAKKCIENMEVEINQLNDKLNWEKRSKLMQTLVDGKGAYRIAECLNEYIES